MINVFNRNNMYEQVTVEGIAQKDIYSIDFKDFDFGEVAYSYVKTYEYARPDLISYRLYGTTAYWWFIMWFNGFCDPWHDIVPDTIVKYPSEALVKQAIKLYSKNA